jgi:tRNA A37 methylthiotransferase MiaB
MLTQQKIAFEKNKSRIGSTITCLIDETEKNNTAKGPALRSAAKKGRFFGQAPEIDPVCLIKKCSAVPGDFVRAKVTGTKGYDLLCEQI